MARDNRTAHRRLILEQLEPRTLLAGNVGVWVSHGDLIIRGSKRDDRIAILHLGREKYAVVGFGGTTVERNDRPLIVRGIDGSIATDLKGGDDLLLIGNDPQLLLEIARDFGHLADDPERLEAELLGLLGQAGAPQHFSAAGNVVVRSGAGNDTVTLVGDIGRELAADLGPGDNALVLVDAVIGADLAARAGRGSDAVILAGVLVVGSLELNLGGGRNVIDAFVLLVGASATFITGNQDDKIDVNQAAIGENLVARLGKGDDYIRTTMSGGGIEVGGGVDIDTGAGRDEVTLRGRVRGNASIRTGSQGDLVILWQLVVHKELFVDTGSGQDIFGAEEVRVLRNMTLNTGSQADEVIVADLVVNRRLTTILGSGEDFARLRDTTAEEAIVLGGSSFDTLHIDAFSLPVNAVVKQFEDIALLVAEEEEEEQPPPPPSSSGGSTSGGSTSGSITSGSITFGVIGINQPTVPPPETDVIP